MSEQLKNEKVYINALVDKMNGLFVISEILKLDGQGTSQVGTPFDEKLHCSYKIIKINFLYTMYTLIIFLLYTFSSSYFESLVKILKSH